MEVFHDYAYYYNAFYRDKDYVREAKQVDILLRKYGSNVKQVINFGCGTGMHDIELARMGYSCTGIDISPIMIEIAKKNNKKQAGNISFSVSDIRSYRAERKFDAVISLFHVMSYQNTNEEILDAFCSARKALNKGGVFLFDVWYGPEVLSDKPAVRVKEVQDDKYKLIRVAKPTMHDKTNVVEVSYDVLVVDTKSNTAKAINEVHNMRYFFRPELEFYLKESGFDLIDNLDCATLGQTGYDSWTSYFIATAI